MTGIVAQDVNSLTHVPDVSPSSAARQLSTGTALSSDLLPEPPVSVGSQSVHSSDNNVAAPQPSRRG